MVFVLEVRESETFSKWLRNLRDNRAKARLRREFVACFWQPRRCAAGWRGHQRTTHQLWSWIPRLLCATWRGPYHPPLWGRQEHAREGHQNSQEAGLGGRMKALKTKPFDPADYLDNDETIAAYMTEGLETGDPAFVSDALGVVARARGMTEVARAAGVSRESLYRALSGEGNPNLDPSCV